MARRRIAEAAILYTIGSLGYCLLELSWRGYTHWSMAVTGGICFFLLYQIDTHFSRRPLLWRCFAGALAVTAVEFAVGCVVNLALGWGVWDYSRMPMQLWGQICLPFFLLWFLLCIPAFGICRGIDRLAAGKEKIVGFFQTHGKRWRRQKNL